MSLVFSRNHASFAKAGPKLVGRVKTIYAPKLHRTGSHETPLDVTAQTFGQQAGANPFRWPQKPGSQGTAAGHGNQRHLWSKGVLEKRNLTVLLCHAPDRVGDHTGPPHEAIGFDLVRDGSRHL
jgi:hypothetical protein